MKNIIILSLLLTSCSSTWHVNRAIKKGYTPEKEIIEVERLELRTVFDTILGELRVDTIRTTETRTVYQDRPLTRWETRLIRDTVRIVQRAETVQNRTNTRADIVMDRINAKVERMRIKKANRGVRWYWWLVVFAGGVAVGVFRKNIWKIVRKLILKL
jgi:hypothetical protein